MSKDSNKFNMNDLMEMGKTQNWECAKCHCSLLELKPYEIVPWEDQYRQVKELVCPRCEWVLHRITEHRALNNNAKRDVVVVQKIEEILDAENPYDCSPTELYKRITQDEAGRVAMGERAFPHAGDMIRFGWIIKRIGGQLEGVGISWKRHVVQGHKRYTFSRK